jgi:hypothetical protein
MLRLRHAATIALAIVVRQVVAVEPQDSEAPKLPTTPVPQFAMVSEILTDEGRIAIQYSTTVTVTEMVTVARVVDGKAVDEQVPRMQQRVEIRTNEAEPRDMIFFGSDGKEVPTENALPRLRVGLMLMRMEGNEPPAPEFLKLLAKDVLIIAGRN